jgi:hypothetical protein
VCRIVVVPSGTERFLLFTPVVESSGKGLTDVIVKFLQKEKFKLKKYTGQSCEYATNVTGKNISVQDYFTPKFIGF